jgi:hypothetical protein
MLFDCVLGKLFFITNLDLILIVMEQRHLQKALIFFELSCSYDQISGN